LLPAVLITGCSSGIGRATALRLAASGRWTVYATARRSSSIRDLEDAGCHRLDLDVTDEGSMERAVAAIEDKHGAVAALVNNAGYSQSGAVEAVPIDRVRAQFETNVFGLLRLTQLVLPGMRRARAGRVVNIGSMGGRLVFPGGGVYHATKYAIEALSDALRFELRGFEIHVVLIEPGLIRTRFGDAAGSAIRDAQDDDVYRPFHAEVARLTKEASEQGMTARLAGTPDDVAFVIEKALMAPRPRARYTVSLSASLFIAQRRFLGDRAWDAFLRRVYPSPGRQPTG
jgi:NAD(P)-dependent dehydrogenase (short-subunit alcohol dehydrogenase family)